MDDHFIKLIFVEFLFDLQGQDRSQSLASDLSVTAAIVILGSKSVVDGDGGSEMNACLLGGPVHHTRGNVIFF